MTHFGSGLALGAALGAAVNDAVEGFREELRQAKARIAALEARLEDAGPSYEAVAASSLEALLEQLDAEIRANFLEYPHTQRRLLEGDAMRALRALVRELRK